MRPAAPVDIQWWSLLNNRADAALSAATRLLTFVTCNERAAPGDHTEAQCGLCVGGPCIFAGLCVALSALLKPAGFLR
ncbi:MAG TPA: hypothetical protein VGP65_07100, partial [Candidatus Angelobacter sp.]|nr:hypothetical protein [Candidatus Angelobacter sp.]